jgi:hypothetical protein
VTVPRGLRASDQRDEARRQLVERAAALEDGLAFVALIRSIADAREFDLFAEALAIRLVLGPGRLPHRRAKQAALARERARRRAAPADPATGGAGVDGERAAHPRAGLW